MDLLNSGLNRGLPLKQSLKLKGWREYQVPKRQKQCLALFYLVCAYMCAHVWFVGAGVPVCGGQRALRNWIPATSLLRHGLLFLLSRTCRLASLWVSGRFSSLPPLSHSPCWDDRCIGPHPASYVCSRLTRLLLSPAATSLPPTFFFYVLQITQGLTNRISIKVNCKGPT